MSFEHRNLPAWSEQCKTFSPTWRLEEVAKAGVLKVMFLGGCDTLAKARVSAVVSVSDTSDTICLVKSGRNYKTYFYLYSGSFLWILVLYLIFAPLHCGWYLADLCGSLRYHTRSSILLHVLGLCSTSSGQSGWQTSLAESSRVPSVRIFLKTVISL